MFERLRLGCCAGATELDLLGREPGLDFVELPVATALMAGGAGFEQLAAAVERAALGATAVNVFLPNTLKVVGPSARLDELRAYARTALDRGRRLGVSILVFGSGAARAVPEGFSRATALDQFAEAVRTVAAEAAVRGIIVAVEPLHAEETNLLNSVAEAAEFLDRHELGGVGLTADLWHMECELEPLDVLAAAGHLVAHAHVAAAGRAAPGSAPDRIEDFLLALRRAGYAGSCSIECKWRDFEAELPGAVGRVREAAVAAGWSAA